MADLHVDFLGKRLAGPVVAASGTFGFGPEYAGIEDLRLLGGISGKGLTLNGQPGNEGERLYETRIVSSYGRCSEVVRITGYSGRRQQQAPSSFSIGAPKVSLPSTAPAYGSKQKASSIR